MTDPTVQPVLADIGAQAEQLAAAQAESARLTDLSSALDNLNATARETAASLSADKLALDSRSSALAALEAQLARLGLASSPGAPARTPATSLSGARARRVVEDLFTVPSRGRLRGWIRVPALAGGFVTRPDPETGAQGDPPSAREWARFDLKTRELGERARRQALRTSTSGRRRPGLGDATSDTLDALAAGDAVQQDALTATVHDLARAQAIRPDPFTDYAGGMLRGWFRAFSTHGYGPIPAPNGPGTVGDPPTQAEWDDFDAQAAALGVGDFVIRLREHAKLGTGTPAWVGDVALGLESFGAALGTAVSFGTATPFIASALFAAVDEAGNKGEFTRVAITSALKAEQMLDKYVPGWSSLIDAMWPVLPFVPLLVNAFAAIASLTPAAVQVAFDSLHGVTSLLSTATLGNTPAAPTAQLDSWMQGLISNAVTTAAKAGANTAAVLAPVQSTLGKALETATTTKGNLAAKVEASAMEAVKGAQLVVQVAAIVVSLGAATPLAIVSASASIASTVASKVAANSTGQTAQIANYVAMGTAAVGLVASFGASGVDITSGVGVVEGPGASAMGADYAAAHAGNAAAEMFDALKAVKAGVDVLQAGIGAEIRVTDALASARDMKRLARASRNLANAKAAQDDSDLEQLRALLAKLEADAAALARRKLVQAQTQTQAPAGPDDTTLLEELVAIGFAGGLLL